MSYGDGMRTFAALSWFGGISQTLEFWAVLEGTARPLGADLSGSARPAADIAGADPAVDLFKGSAKPSLLPSTVNMVAAD